MRLLFSDHSFIEDKGNDILRYGKNGFGVDISVESNYGNFAKGKILNTKIINFWDVYPHNCPSQIDKKSKQEIIDKITSYYQQRGLQCDVK